MPIWIEGKRERGLGGRINNYPSPINMTGDSPQDWNVTEEKRLEKCCVCRRERESSQNWLRAVSFTYIHYV